MSPGLSPKKFGKIVKNPLILCFFKISVFLIIEQAKLSRAFLQGIASQAELFYQNRAELSQTLAKTEH